MRRQSIISTLIILIGFSIGFINTLLYTKNDIFTEKQYGLSKTIFDWGQLLYIFSFLGITSVVYKFSPYYKAHLQKKDNDLLAWSLILPTVMFIVVSAFLYFTRTIFVQKFIAKSPELIPYFYWIFPLAYSLLIFSILEVHIWAIQQSVVANLIREIGLRAYHTILIVLFATKQIGFDVFVKLLTGSFFLLAIVSFIYLYKKGQIHITIKKSIVTKKFFKPIVSFAGFIYVGMIIILIASLFDSITISSIIGQDGVGLLALMTYICNIMYAPQKAIVSVAVIPLAEAWRVKDMKLIEKIYKRSCINLLIVGLFVFFLAWLNFDDVIKVLGMKTFYLSGKYVLLFLGIKTIFDLGTGINSYIIATSNYWKFEFFTGIILLSLIVPLNYYLVKSSGVEGAGIANLIAYTIYNLIRLVFLWRKFKFQPFDKNNFLALIIAIFGYLIVYYSTLSLVGVVGILVKSIFFAILFVIPTYYFNLTPDFKPVLVNALKRFKFKRN